MPRWKRINIELETDLDAPRLAELVRPHLARLLDDIRATGAVAELPPAGFADVWAKQLGSDQGPHRWQLPCRHSDWPETDCGICPVCLRRAAKGGDNA